MGRKATTISLGNDDRSYLEAQTRARTIQAQTVNRVRILYEPKKRNALHQQIPCGWY